MVNYFDKSRLSQWFGISILLLTGLFTIRLVVDTLERMIYPFLTPIAAGLGITVTTMGLILSFRSWIGMVGPVIGVLADRYGKKRIMVIGLGTQVVGVATLLLAQGWWAVVPMVLLGLGSASFVPVQLAYVSDQVGYKTRGRALASVDMAFSVAGIVSLPIVGWLIDNYSWRAPYAILGCLAVVTTGFAWRFLPEAPVTSQPKTTGSPFAGFKVATRTPAVLYAVLLAALVFYTFAGFSTVWALWLDAQFALSTTEIGFMATNISLAELTGVVISILFIDRIGKKLGVQIGFVLATLFFLSWLLLPHTPFSSRLNLILLGGVLEYNIVSFFPLISDQLPEARATLFTFAGIGISVGLALGPAVNLFLWDRFGLAGIVLSMLAVLLFATWIVSRKIE